MSPRLNIKKLFECYDRNCEAKLETWSKRIIHINEVHRGMVLCPYKNCQTSLKTSSIYQHINEIHEQKVGKEQCTLCGKMILKKNLSRHLKRCSNEGKKNFLCMIQDCQSSFEMETDFLQHVELVHTSPKKCPYDDCTIFIKPAGLRQHVKIVHQKLKKVCHICGKQISFPNLRKHVKRCTSRGEKKFRTTFQGTFVNYIRHLEGLKKPCSPC